LEWNKLDKVNDVNTAREGTAFGKWNSNSSSIFGGTSRGGSTAMQQNLGMVQVGQLNDLNTARGYLGNAGTNTAALAFGGQLVWTAATESWNGTSWTEVNDLNTARRILAGAGYSNISFSFWWFNSTCKLTATELWNGTSWTSSPGLMNTAR
jgi:hypothetical protein